MSKEVLYEEIAPYVFVTKLAGFEHTEYIQPYATKYPMHETDIPMVQGKNIRNGSFVEKYDWYIKKSISDDLPRSVLNRRCILIPYVGSNLGEVGIFPNNYRCHLASNVAKVELNSDKYLLEYMMYYMQSPIGQSYLFQAKQGSSQPNITMESIRSTQIIKRTIEEQEKIVRILGSIDAQIKRNNQMVHKLQVLAQTIYYRWFIQFEYPNANVELAYNNELKRQTPVGWEVKKLSEVCKINLGGTPKTDIKEYWNGNIHWLNSGEVANFPVVTSELMITESGVENSATKLLKAGTTIVSITGNIRASFLAIDSCANQSVVGIEENDLYKVGYIYPFIDNLLAHFTRSSTGNCQKHINKGAIEDAKILIPPQKIMHEYNALVQRIYNEIKETSLMTLSLTSLKNKLLPLLINQQLL